MSVIKNLMVKKSGSVYAFAKEVGWSFQRTYYIANKDPRKMNNKKLEQVCLLLECDLKDVLL